jgi:hypothetical protein
LLNLNDNHLKPSNICHDKIELWDLLTYTDIFIRMDTISLRFSQ